MRALKGPTPVAEMSIQVPSVSTRPSVTSAASCACPASSFSTEIGESSFSQRIPSTYARPGLQQEVALVGRRRDLEPGVVLGHPAASDHVDARRLVEVRVDVDLLVPVGVQLDAPLLHDDAAVVPLLPESHAGQVTFHDGSLHVT